MAEVDIVVPRQRKKAHDVEYQPAQGACEEVAKRQNPRNIPWQSLCRSVGHGRRTLNIPSARGALLWMAWRRSRLSAGNAHVVNSVYYFSGYLVETCRRRLSAYVRGSAHQRSTERLAQGGAEPFAGEAHGDSAIGGAKPGAMPLAGETPSYTMVSGRSENSMRCMPLRALRSQCARAVQIADKHNHGFGIGTLFYPEDSFHSFPAPCVAAYAPHRVGGVEYHSTFAEHFGGGTQVGAKSEPVSVIIPCAWVCVAWKSLRYTGVL